MLRSQKLMMLARGFEIIWFMVKLRKKQEEAELVVSPETR
jgi:hypothetical protein